jgi:carbon monoxide dehydrogenase subunit G
MEQLTNEFRVGVPIEQAYEVLTDVELIAPCLPGAQLQEIEGDEYRGVVKVKVGPITANYKGAATFVHRQPPTKLVLRAEGRETRGQGNANATITLTLTPDGDSTQVTVVTDLTVTGKVAQFGRGVLGDVSAKLLGQFVECLSGKVAAGEVGSGSGPAAEAPSSAEVPAATTPADVAPAASPVEAPVVTDEPVEAATPTAPSSNGNGAAPPVVEAEPVDGEAVDPVPAAAAKPAVRKIDSPEPAPVDLLATAGNPVAKRAAPVLAGVAVLWLLRLLLKRRKR